MPEIQVPELARKLARRFQITGDPIAPTLAPEIVPIALVEDLTGADMQDTGFERAAWGGDAQAAAAGNNSHMQLFNPSGSGVIVLLEAVVISCPTGAASIQMNVHDTALTTASTAKGWRDRRLSGNTAAQIRSQNNAAILGSNRATLDIGIANESYLFPMDAILAPAQGLVYVPVAQNHTLRCVFYWTERQALSTE